MTTAMLAQVASVTIENACLMGMFEFDSGDVGFWTGYGTLEWNGMTFTGGGHLIGITPYNETQNMQAENITFELSGVPAELTQIALEQKFQGRPCTLWFGIVQTLIKATQESAAGYIDLEDDSGDLLFSSSMLGDPYPIFDGIMDQIQAEDTPGATSTIRLQAENILAQLTRTKERRYTPEDQKARYPGDTGLDDIPQLQDRSVVWGGKSPEPKKT